MASLLWRRFDPWPGNVHMPRAQPKRETPGVSPIKCTDTHVLWTFQGEPRTRSPLPPALSQDGSFPELGQQTSPTTSRTVHLQPRRLRSLLQGGNSVPAAGRQPWTCRNEQTWPRSNKTLLTEEKSQLPASSRAMGVLLHLICSRKHQEM